MKDIFNSTMKNTLIIFGLFCTHTIKAQELFTWTEPASNMAAKSIGIRATNLFMKENNSRKYNFRLNPELMWGISAKWMLHAELFTANEQQQFNATGGSLYLKYRFYSADDIHSHFRMAVYGRGAFTNAVIHQPAIDFNGYNSGYELGLIATKLSGKTAVSLTAGWLHAADNTSGNKFVFSNTSRNAYLYNLSIGRLMLPRSYTSYKQTNCNLMLEMLGQVNAGSGRSYLDAAPVVQFIVMSRMRIDGSYRFPVLNDLYRMSPRGFLIRVEYNFFNVY